MSDMHMGNDAREHLRAACRLRLCSTCARTLLNRWHAILGTAISKFWVGDRPGEAVETIPRPAEALEIIPGPEEASETIPLPPSRAPRLWGPLARRGSGGRWGGRAPRERRRGPRCVPLLWGALARRGSGERWAVHAPRERRRARRTLRSPSGGVLARHGSGGRWAVRAPRERRRARRTLRSPSGGVLARHGSGGRWAVRAPRERRRARRMSIRSDAASSSAALPDAASLRPRWLPEAMDLRSVCKGFPLCRLQRRVQPSTLVEVVS